MAYPDRKTQEIPEPTKAKIRQLLDKGVSTAKIAADLGFSQTQIAGIKATMKNHYKPSADAQYPEAISRDLSDREKEEIRRRIRLGDDNVHQLAYEFQCSWSQIAGIKATM